MTDPYRKVRPGESLAVSAAGWNAAMEAGRSEKARRHSRGFETGDQRRDAAIVRVKNEAGAELPWQAVIGLNAPIFTPDDSEEAFRREVTFRGVEPTEDHAGKFGILQEPAQPGQVIRAIVAGVAIVRLNVTDEAEASRAEVEAGVTGYLVAGRDGSADVLWREGGTGEQWSIVRVAACCDSGSGGDSLSRCDCPESEYEVEVECGDCTDIQPGTPRKMPRFWWLDIVVATPFLIADGGGHGDEICDITCTNLDGIRVRLRHDEDCTWIGGGSDLCVEVELTTDGTDWILTITAANDCVIAVLRKPVADFDCCGPNSGWATDDGSECEIVANLTPHECTCCPVEWTCENPSDWGWGSIGTETVVVGNVPYVLTLWRNPEPEICTTPDPETQAEPCSGQVSDFNISASNTLCIDPDVCPDGADVTLTIRHPWLTGSTWRLAVEGDPSNVCVKDLQIFAVSPGAQPVCPDVGAYVSTITGWMPAGVYAIVVDVDSVPTRCGDNRPNSSFEVSVACVT